MRVRWIQWATSYGKYEPPNKIHGTQNGRRTLCDKPVPIAKLIYEGSSPPEGGSVCSFCQQFADELKRYDRCF